METDSISFFFLRANSQLSYTVCFRMIGDSERETGLRASKGGLSHAVFVIGRPQARANVI